MLEVAVVGCGFIGAGEPSAELGVQSHLAAWTRHPEARVVAVADPDEARRESAVQRWAVPLGFASLEELLDRVRPEIVSLCGPDRVHGEQLRAALGARSVRAILAEKPLALELAEAERATELARTRGVTLAVNYGRRFLPSHRALRSWLAAGGIGRIEAVEGCYVRGIKHNGTHWLDLARYLVGEVVEIAGDGETGGDDPTIDASLRFAGGARGRLLGLRSLDSSLFEMDLFGSAGRARLVEAGQRFEITTPRDSRRFAGFRELQPAPGPKGGLHDLLWHPVEALVRALREGSDPACTGEDATRALQLALEAIETADRARSHVAQRA